MNSSSKTSMSEFQIIKGMPFPKYPWFKKENIEETLEYMPKDGDIIIASYPKTGTTWLQYIVIQITSKGESFPSYSDIMDRNSPSMEMAGPEVIDNLTGLRIYRHHYRYDAVKKNPKSKVLYIYRNPEDAFISLFHFMKNVLGESSNLEEFFEQYLTGNKAYGNYFEHVLTYLNQKDDDNLLLISYEKLHSNPKEGILRIAKFLGDEYYEDLSTDESLLNKIVRNTSFDHMQKNLKFEIPNNNPKKRVEDCSLDVKFFRKGVVGDGKTWLSTEHVKRMREKATEFLKNTEVLKEWIKE